MSGERRLSRNAESRRLAEHHGEPWGQWELELLMMWVGGDDDLTYIATELGRTIEACRQQFYICRREGMKVTVTRTTTTTTTTTTSVEYKGWMEGDEDE